MGSYLMGKNGFEELADYTVGQIEGLLTPIKIVYINGNPAQQNYRLKRSDKAIIAVEMPQKKNVLIKD